ncbi:MAG: HPr serine kinase protein [Marmoricola sp.]|nr:HPr serine kinase protein [Marmoricola sp.]
MSTGSTTYTCYGLTLSSEIALPDLGEPLTDAGPADVVVRFGPLEAPPASAEQLPYSLWRDGSRCGVLVPDVGRYEARDGNEVVIDALPDADPRAIRLFLLGTVLGAVMMQRDHLVLHGNAIRVGDAVAVVVGHSGAGKSTLAAEFDRRGFDVLSDDVVPVDADGLAVPGHPRIKLWDDALARLGVATDGLERINDDHEKFQLPLRRNEIAALPLRWVYVLERHAGTELDVVGVHGAATFGLLHEHTYRNELVHGPEAVAQHLRQCARLVSGARVSLVRRPAATMTVEATADAILADIEQDLPPGAAAVPASPQECA